MKWTQVIFLAVVLVGVTAGFNFGNQQQQAKATGDWVFYGGHKFLEGRDGRSAAVSDGIVLNRRPC